MTVKPESGQKNEGEGDRTAARSYNEQQREFLKGVDVERLADKAREAFEGSEGEELRRAEKAGKSRMKEEDPAVRGKSTTFKRA